jgi:predicted LPLAT superfamily acyltransferase
VFAVKETSSHYHFFATEARRYETASLRSIREDELRPIIKDYICRMENILEHYPLQWFNYHKFWEAEKE